MAIWNSSATRLLGVGALGAGLALQVLTGPAMAWASDDTADIAVGPPRPRNP